MSRRRAAEKRPVTPDPKYGDTVLSKFVACMMMHGKRALLKKLFMTHWRRLKAAPALKPLPHSARRWKMSSLLLKCGPAGLVALHIRCQWKCVLNAPRRWLFAG